VKYVFILFSFTLTHHFAVGQFYNQKIADKLIEIKSVVPHLDSFQSFGVKEEGTDALSRTGDWLLAEIENMSLTGLIDSFQSNTGIWQRNVITDLTGIDNSKYILIGAHYDTRIGVGANDNGSGVATLLETMRVLRTETLRYSIRFVFFSGEERGFWGSKHYTDSILAVDNRELVFMYNIDQVGGTSGSAENKIYCERDEIMSPNHNNLASARITDTLSKLVSLYSSLEPVIAAAYSSDYLPFEAKGKVICGLYQFPDYPFTHSVSDSIQYLDTNYLNQVARITVSSLLHFTQTPGFVQVENPKVNSFKIFPNPTSDLLNIVSKFDFHTFEICDMKGREVKAGMMHGNSIDVSELECGIYLLKVSGDLNTSYKKFIKH